VVSLQRDFTDFGDRAASRDCLTDIPELEIEVLGALALFASFVVKLD